MAQPADDFQTTTVQNRLRTRGLKHLRARKYGSTIIVESGPKGAAFKHFRLRRDAVHLWLLDMGGHGRHWDRTPFRAQLAELVDLVIETFPWTLADVAQNLGTNFGSEALDRDSAAMRHRSSFCGVAAAGGLVGRWSRRGG